MDNSMIINFAPALPCAQFADDVTSQQCGIPTTTGVVVPTEAGVWELLPVCLTHYQAAVHDLGVDAEQVMAAGIQHRPDQHT